MKKILSVIVSIMLSLSFSSIALQAEEIAKEKGSFGAGIILGEPIGPNVKYWINSNAAVDFGLGFHNDFSVYSDFLWHDWKILPQPSKGTLGGYLGLGVRYEETEGNDKFGFRTVAGVDYWIDSYPVEVYLEVAPVFQVSPDTDTEFDGGIGVRYYFAKF